MAAREVVLRRGKNFAPQKTVRKAVVVVAAGVRVVEDKFRSWDE